MPVGQYAALRHKYPPVILPKIGKMTAAFRQGGLYGGVFMVQLLMLPLGEYQTNCYIAWASGSGTCVVVDPGYEAETVLEKSKIVDKKIEAVILTHGHFDHVGAVEEIVKETGCPVYIHQADHRAKPEMLFPLAGKAFDQLRFLEEGQVLHLAGLDIQVLHTPGHTPGSVCLAFEDCLITGDTLFAGSIGRTDFPGGNWDAMAASLKRLKGIKAEYDVFPGHGEATKLTAEKRSNPYLKDLGL